MRGRVRPGMAFLGAPRRGSPWDAYAVINDGRSPGERTRDAAFLTLTTRYTF